MSHLLGERQIPLSLIADPFDLFNVFFKDINYYNKLDLKTLIKDNNDNYKLTIEIPGFNDDEINIEVKNRKLRITAEHKNDNENYFSSKVDREWSLPPSVNEDEITASLKNGILTVTIPKKETTDSKTIKIIKE
jgi:HSP20 family protein